MSSLPLLLSDHLVKLLIEGLKYFCRQLSAHLLYFDLIGPELELFILQLAVEAVKLVLQRFDLVLLFRQLRL